MRANSYGTVPCRALELSQYENHDGKITIRCLKLLGCYAFLEQETLAVDLGW